MREQRFCPLCHLALALHDGPDSCSAAESKASLLDLFYASVEATRRGQR